MVDRAKKGSSYKDMRWVFGTEEWIKNDDLIYLKAFIYFNR
jgi:hypothetical protein